jgi:hypothetical protein
MSVILLRGTKGKLHVRPQMCAIATRIVDTHLTARLLLSCCQKMVRFMYCYVLFLQGQSH